MKKLFLVLLLSIILLNFVFYNYSSKERPNCDIQEIEQFSHPIHFNDPDKNHLDSLSDILSNKQIIFLGEQLHTDGSTFEVKSKLIQLLHEKFGYNVILYEAGLYDMWVMNNEMNSLQDIDISKLSYVGLYDFWWDNSFCKSLWQYFLEEKNKNNPITLGGFDIQMTASISSTQRYDMLCEYLTTKDIHSDNYPALQRNKDNLDKLNVNWYQKRMAQTSKDSLLSELAFLTKKLTSKRQNISDDIYIRYLNGLKNRYQSVWQYEPGTIESMNLRDSLMADNLIWLIDSVYTNQKIIVWTANIHSFKDSVPNYDFKPMGKYISDKYKDSLFTIAFTSFAHHNGKGGIKNKASNRSLEYILHQAKEPYLYINMKDIPPHSWMKDQFISVMNQGLNEKADWAQLVDCIFYIDIVTPIEQR